MPAEPPRPWFSFPATRLSLVDRIRSGESPVRHQAFDALVTAYWKAVYTYLRVHWRLGPEDAEDTTQAFLAVAYERRFFDPFDPARARFRTFLRVCLDRFVQNQQKAATRQKRGGGVQLLPLDFENAEGELRTREPAAPGDLDQLFRQEVVRALFARAVDAVREECRRTGRVRAFELFERYDLEAPGKVTYAVLAGELGLTVTQVTNQLAFARRVFRAAVLEGLREMTATEDEFRAEARELLGTEIP